MWAMLPALKANATKTKRACLSLRLGPLSSSPLCMRPIEPQPSELRLYRLPPQFGNALARPVPTYRNALADRQAAFVEDNGLAQLGRSQPPAVNALAAFVRPKTEFVHGNYHFDRHLSRWVWVHDYWRS